MQIVIDIPEDLYKTIKSNGYIYEEEVEDIALSIIGGTPLTPDELAYALMEERIRGELDSDTTYEEDVIRDVKCILTVSIRDRRPCYCGAELREVWRERKENAE